jgi:hypothetical protein
MTSNMNNTTLSSVGFVSEPNTRGTVGLIWNCLATIFLCTWTSLHLKVTRTNNRFWYKVAHFFGTIFFPEGFLYQAVSELRQSLTYRDKVRACGGDWTKWTLKQSFLVEMGGITASRNMKELPCIIKSMPPGERFEIHDFPDNAAIEKRSKTDSLAKIIAVAQALYFACSTISRLAQGLTVSLLEDITMAYVACGVFIFIANLEKPQDLLEPFHVQLPGDNADEPDIRVKSWIDGSDRNWPVYVLVGIFTAIHVAEWNYEYPTIAEAWMWRAVSVTSGVIMAVFIIIPDHYNESILVYFLAFGYFTMRTCLLVEAFVSLRSTPADLYTLPSWSPYWGHIGS